MNFGFIQRRKVLVEAAVMILLPLRPASLIRKNSQGRRIIDGLRPLGCKLWSLDLRNVFEECLVCRFWNCVLKLLPPNKRVILSAHKIRLRIISEWIDRNISTQIILQYCRSVYPLCLPYMESRWLNLEDGGQWFIIRQSLLMLKGNWKL